jgi:hypothetical protein
MWQHGDAYSKREHTSSAMLPLPDTSISWAAISDAQ